MQLRSLALALALLLPVGGTALSQEGGGKARSGSSRIPSISNMPYKPTPAIELIPPLPDPNSVPKANPTGQYNAYDLNAYETIWFPERQPGDADAKAAPGGAITHGTCPPNGCANHSLEFGKFWVKTMTPLVRPLGGTVHSYKFFSSGSNLPPYVFAQPAGLGQNLQAIVPGSEHPEQMVIVSGHYDQTDSGPGSAWDSAEGHATVIRIAKVMMDYWRKTGTRPAVSVKFTAWDGEEAGSNGSAAYVRDNIQPFPNGRVRGYFNLDPCAGAYPAYYRGNPAIRTPMVMQLANPETTPIPANRGLIEAFNTQAREIVGDVFNHLDDNLTDVPGSPEIFISDEEAERDGTDSQEDEVVTALGGLAQFTSDYANFERIGIPILNLFPDYFGPHEDGTQGRVDGIGIIHTPNDNLRSLNALTGVDQSGSIPSEGWYKGLEMCAHMHSWFMLQANMGGATAVGREAVAYFEARSEPNLEVEEQISPFTAGKQIKFDASGSHAYATADYRSLIPADKLRFSWDFGDGAQASGLKVSHAYRKSGSYKAVLTVQGPGGLRDAMTLFISIP